jgi:hypothetical protein
MLAIPPPVRGNRRRAELKATRDLAARFEAYGDWRRRLSAGISALHDWLQQQDLADARVDLKLQHLQERLRHDQLIVAFVAEFSRGKSELINAIFFADFGKRLLPSSAGRTTMCPTELLYDPSDPPAIRLLPIETRLRDASVAEFKRYPEEWTVVALDLASADQMGEALRQVSQVKRVPAAEAATYGLHDVDGTAAREAGDDAVDIPCWRHAVINFPHPLLQQGLVILDTPGLNAIGAEPELTLSQLPDAHAVLFILAADAGVTKTDLDVWTQHLAGEETAAKANRIVVLNKIDGLWDELKAETDVDAEIGRQVADSARVLGISATQVFAVSAQKALLAKVNGDDALLARSRLPALEAALSGRMIPAKREIVGSAIRSEVRALAAGARATLDARRNGVAAQLAELSELRGKNQDVVVHMMNRIRDEKALFERDLHRFTALRTVFTEHANRLFDCIGFDALRANAGQTRRRIEASPFTKGIRGAMSDFFGTIHSDFDRAAKETAEIQELMQAMYARFAEERDLERLAAPPFSMLKYQKEIERLERAYNTQFNTLWNMVSKAKFALMRRFFETIASRVKHGYDIANRDVDTWLRAVMSPLETQVREHHLQLRRRLDSIKRIQGTSGELEARVAELEESVAALAAQIRALDEEVAAIDSVIAQPDALPLAANG